MTLTRFRLITYAATHRIPELHWAHDMLRALDASGAQPPCLTRYILLCWLSDREMHGGHRYDWAHLDDAASAADPSPHLAALSTAQNKADAARALHLAADVERGAMSLRDAIRKMGGTPYEIKEDTAT